MTYYAGECYELASLGGIVAYGALMTKWGAMDWKMHDFGPGGGMGAPGIKPAKIKKVPMLTLSGTLVTTIGALAGSICAFDGQAFNDNSRKDAVAGETAIYGDPNGDGFTTSGCVGTRLTISGTTNQLVTFSLDMFGKVTTSTTGPAGGAGDTAEFFPFELGTNTLGASLLGFTLTADTGLIPVFGMNSQGPAGWVNLGDVGATCTLGLTVNDNQLWAACQAITLSGMTITLASPGGGSLAIVANGFYLNYDRGPVAGLIGHNVILSGFGASMLSIT